MRNRSDRRSSTPLETERNEYGTSVGNLGWPGKRTLSEGLGPSREVPHREEMERAFGEDFSTVSAHLGPAAAETSSTLAATAFTIGEQIAFREASPSRELVAHELTHVVQQRRGQAAVAAKDDVSTPNDAHEIEADRVATIVAGGGSAIGLVTQAGPPVISRKIDVFDVADIFTSGAGTMTREHLKRSGAHQLVADINTSIVNSPKYAPEIRRPRRMPPRPT